MLQRKQQQQNLLQKWKSDYKKYSEIEHSLKSSFFAIMRQIA